MIDALLELIGHLLEVGTSIVEDASQTNETISLEIIDHINDQLQQCFLRIINILKLANLFGKLANDISIRLVLTGEAALDSILIGYSLKQLLDVVILCFDIIRLTSPNDKGQPIKNGKDCIILILDLGILLQHLRHRSNDLIGIDSPNKLINIIIDNTNDLIIGRNIRFNTKHVNPIVTAQTNNELSSELVIPLQLDCVAEVEDVQAIRILLQTLCILS